MVCYPTQPWDRFGDPQVAQWQAVNPVPLPGQRTADDAWLRLQWIGQLDAALPAGRYDVVAKYIGQPARCTWLASNSEYCVIGPLVVSDAPLPADAIRFEDKIALLSVDIPEKQLAPGGHIGLFMGSNTLRETWPKIGRWLRERSAGAR